MVTAVMSDPQGNVTHPRYEQIIFDTLPECQSALQVEEFYGLMWATVQIAYPQQTLQNLGCGAWDMTNIGAPEAETQPLIYH